jgi:hypothetical protein
VTLVEDNDVVQAVSPDAADQAFDIRVLLGAARGGKDLFDDHAPHASTKRLAINRIAIQEEVHRRAIPRESLDDLLSRPVRSRIPHDIPPCRLREHQQHPSCCFGRTGG